jgi:alpha-tubulin suppressor-like RCC1 family protein
MQERLSIIVPRFVLAAGQRHTAAVKADGTAVAAGDNKCGQCGIHGWSGIRTTGLAVRG